MSCDDVSYLKTSNAERMSTKVSIQNTIFRSRLNGHMFLNDPDVFLLRDDNIGLSREQRKALTLINALFGSLLMTSDEVGSYDAEKKALLDRALALFRGGRALSYERKGDTVRVDYELDGRRAKMIYDMEKGILSE
jgi:alpha-galactosidase